MVLLRFVRYFKSLINDTDDTVIYSVNKVHLFNYYVFSSVSIVKEALPKKKCYRKLQ